jgi:hypothetical protein
MISREASFYGFREPSLFLTNIGVILDRKEVLKNE